VNGIRMCTDFVLHNLSDWHMRYWPLLCT